MRIGVLALQGDFDAHARAIRAAGGEPAKVRGPAELGQVRGLIIPGGESTTIGKLIVRWGLEGPIRERATAGMPLWGTCAGMILLAERVEGSEQLRLGLMDITVRRNAYGRQVDSFETDTDIAGLSGGPMRVVFIRAPIVIEHGPSVEVAASIDDTIVMVRQGNLWGTSFHPELTDDTRLHRAFIELAAGAGSPLPPYPDRRATA